MAQFTIIFTHTHTKPQLSGCHKNPPAYTHLRQDVHGGGLLALWVWSAVLLAVVVLITKTMVCYPEPGGMRKPNFSRLQKCFNKSHKSLNPQILFRRAELRRVRLSGQQGNPTPCPSVGALPFPVMLIQVPECQSKLQSSLAVGQMRLCWVKTTFHTSSGECCHGVRLPIYTIL